MTSPRPEEHLIDPTAAEKVIVLSPAAAGDVDATSQAPQAGYTATDDGLGVTDDSVRAWVNQRTRFGVFVHAEVCGVADAAGPDYSDWNGRPTPPTLVLTDERGRSLALNGTPCGFDGVGPRAAAQILLTEGLLPAQDALAVVANNRTLSLQPTPQVDREGLLPDAVAVDPDALALWSAHERWREVLREISPRLPADPHFPALVSALERMEAAGVDAKAALAAVTGPAGGLLPEFHAGRGLHNRLLAASASAGNRAPSPTPVPTTALRPCPSSTPARQLDQGRVCSPAAHR